jgi:pyruvate dehydrogenase E2 component (dihydrolipoamide acetyltransferase)
MRDFLMPSLGADMEAGTLVAWRKQPGDAIHRGDIVAEVDTAKGVIEVEVFVDGVVERILVEPGRRVPVGTPLARLRETHEPAAAAITSAQGLPAAPVETGELPATSAVGLGSEQATAAPSVPSPAPRPTVAVGGRASPSARRLARERGVDLANVTGTGPRGTITQIDVERAAVPGPALAAPPVPEAVQAAGTGDRLVRMRRTIAAAMARSKREIPHYYLRTTIDMHHCIAWLAAENDRRPAERRFLPGALLLKATALALREVPELNAVWEQDGVVLRDAVHVGVAISLRQGGLVVAALHDTQSRSLESLMDGLRDLTTRGRAGRLRSSELSDSTITVTSLGDRGVESVYGVIYPPQVALVGFGKVVERPWAADGGLFVRPVVTATLAADHRVTDGHRGGLFLDAIDRLLQEPERL